jgi:integrase
MGNVRAPGARSHAEVDAQQFPLVPASREAFRAANLTFHDLRHEAGWPLHNVAHMLGHANISQTSTYLNATKVGLQDSMRRLDARRAGEVTILNRDESGSPEPTPLGQSVN